VLIEQKARDQIIGTWTYLYMPRQGVSVGKETAAEKNISGFGECGHSCTAGSACGWPVSPKLGRRIGSFVLCLTAAYRDTVINTANISVSPADSRLQSSQLFIFFSKRMLESLHVVANSVVESAKTTSRLSKLQWHGAGSRSNLIMKQARLWQRKIARLKKRHARLCRRA
jgi:hypothetical protein